MFLVGILLRISNPACFAVCACLPQAWHPDIFFGGIERDAFEMT
jgi:hypothetical protein